MVQKLNHGITRNEDVQFILDSFKKQIGQEKLENMRQMFVKGYIQKIQKESKKKMSNLVYYDDYLRTFDEYKAFNWLFKKTFVTF